MEIFTENFVDFTTGKKIIADNFAKWTSGNEIIDNFIQEKQSKHDGYGTLFEWIPYSELVDIKEIGNNYLAAAICKKELLFYDSTKWVTKSYEKVCLRHMRNSEDISDEFINKVESYLANYRHLSYGISQNKDTKEYILVFEIGYFQFYCEKCGDKCTDKRWCQPCQINHLKSNPTNRTSGNEKIDNLIQKLQLKISNYEDAVFKWIPFDEFIDIEEIIKDEIFTALWKDRKSYNKVCLRYLHNSQDVTDKFINEIESYLLDYLGKGTHNLYQNYGVSYNPDTRNYIIVLNDTYLKKYCKKCGNRHEDWFCKSCFLDNHIINCSGDLKIDNFIKEKLLKFNIIFEWIPYSELINIKEIKNNCLIIAIWKDGPLQYDIYEEKWIRYSYQKVCLRYLHNSRDITDEFINEVESYLLKENNYRNYGISRSSDTGDYILVYCSEYYEKYCEKCGNKYENTGNFYTFVNNNDKLCKSCQINYLKNNKFINSGNEKIDDFIQKMQLKIDHSKVFEWIPYNEFIEIKKVEESFLFTTIWKDGPLYYDINEERWIRKSYEKVYFKYSRNITDELLSEIESEYYNETYGISRSSDTGDYILVFHSEYLEKYCKKCGNKYGSIKWCKPCQTNCLKRKFMEWTSGNEKIDSLIQKKQLKIDSCNDTIFEWIPYNKFYDIKEIRKDDFAIGILKDGPLCYTSTNKKYKRKLNEKVLLKYIHRSRNINSEFLNKIEHSIEDKKIYGISQDPNTEDFIFILQPKYHCENCGGKYNNKFEVDNKSCILCQTKHENEKISDLIQEMKLNINHNSSESDMIFEWIPYEQFNDIKEIGEGGFSTVYSAIWGDGLLNYTIDSQYRFNSKWKRKSNTKVALKRLHNSQNFIDEFINEVKAYPNQKTDNILKIYGISQNPETKDYIIVLEYAEGGDFNNYLSKNYENFDWFSGLKILDNIIKGLSEIHQKQMVHRDFHTGNILITKVNTNNSLFVNHSRFSRIRSSGISLVVCISDMGLCKNIGDIDETSIYGVMPYVAPEVLKGNPYTQAADIYSFGMIMYVVATGKQPFANCAHDSSLASAICNGIRPQINEIISPKCYIDLMKKCWDSDPR